MGSSLPTQVAALAQRSVLRTVRQPAVIISALLFPLMFFSINAYGLDAAARIPGFPADSYLDFAFAFPLIQASLFGAITAGADLARDIESGFFDRLSLTPMRPVALLLGMLAGIVALGLLQGVVFLTDRKSTRLNSSHANISYAVFCLKKKNKNKIKSTV